MEQALIIQALAYGNRSVTLKHFQKQVVRSLGVWMARDSGGGGGVKIKLFKNMVMLHILKRIKNAATCHMVANILPTDTPPPPRPLGRESRMKQHGSKYFAPYPYSPPSPTLGMGSVGQNSTSPTLGMGSVGQNSTFSEHRHVAYLKENQECSNMPHGSKYFAHRHPHSPTTLGKRIKNAATW